MPQSFAAVRVHLVFSTKLRAPVFKDPVIRSQLHSYLGETCNRLECPVLRVGGVEDHIHILAGLGRTITLAEWVKELKRVSNAWIRERMATPGFEWQAGYGAFGVSQSLVPTVID